MSASERPTPRDPSVHGLLRRGLRVIGVALRGAPRPFAVGVGGAALFAVATVAASLVLGWVTDEVLLPQFEAGEVDAAALTLAALAIVGVGLVKATGVLGRRLGAYLAQFQLQAMYRQKVTRQYLRLPLRWHRRHPTGELLSNANADVESAFFVAAPLPMAMGASILLVLTGGLLVVTDPALAAIGFSVGPLLIFANWFYQRRMRYAATVAQQARADVSEVAHESFDGALVVKTMGREQAEADRFRGISEDLRDKMIRVGRLRAFFDPVIEALPNIAILLVLFVGAYRVRDGALTPGDLVLFAYLFRLVALPMRVFGWLLGELPRAVVGWDRVSRVLDETGEMVYGRAPAGGQGGAATQLDEVRFRHPAPERGDLAGPDATGPRQRPAGSGPQAAGSGAQAAGSGARPVGAVIAADRDGGSSGEHDREHDDRDGNGTDPQRRGIESVSFDVPAGRTIALVGATGSGKSTVASLLVRLFDPDQGSITFDGRELSELDRDQLASNVAIVFQEAFLFDDTVRDNITLGLDLPDADVEAAARLAQAHGFVTELEHGYDTPVGERGATLSGGQRQRIALARAIVRKPRLLVLDDATSAVDPSVESDILRGLADSDLPSTVIVVAYRKGSIALADEVVFLREGQVAARGSHERLLEEEPSYANLVTAYERDAAERDAMAAGQDPGGIGP